MAAICHDLEHPGKDNGFHITSHSPLALLYNDISVLENHHCCRAFTLMQDPRVNILGNLSHDQFKETRKAVISAILATDMVHHFESISKLATYLDSKGDDKEKIFRENKDKQMLVNILLHSADISNCVRPLSVSVFSKFTNEGVVELERQGLRGVPPAGAPTSFFTLRRETKRRSWGFLCPPL